MKIIIYSINRMTLHIADSIRKEHEILGISDSYAMIDIYGPYRFIEQSKIPDMNFDYIVISNIQRRTYESIKDYLVNNYKLPHEKIVSFYAMFSEERVDQIMQMARINGNCFTGMILGISHAMVGINPFYLEGGGEWCNLAVAGEDIYYHEKVFSKCTQEYKECINGLKNIIIDLYDYSVFGYDTSQGKYAGDYFGNRGGYTEDLHNFSKNTNYMEHEIEKTLFDMNCYSSVYARQSRDLRKSIFDEEMVLKIFNYKKGISTPTPYFFREYLDPSAFCNTISEKPDLPGELFYNPNIRDETIKENVESLYKLIAEIKKFNNKIKIYFVLLPRYYTVEFYHTKLMEEWKLIFEKIIIPIMNEENISLLNYKSCEAINRNRNFYHDPGHLNQFGAIAFTSMLNKDLI